MGKAASASNLLGRAAAVYDLPGSELPGAAQHAWAGGFASGGRWMSLALRQIRPQTPAGSKVSLQRLGIAKYGMASAAMLGCALVAAAMNHPIFGLAGVVGFYVVEAQMVFLFPLALDGCEDPLRQSLRWTARAGGTLAVMRVVVPLGVTMLFGGLAGRGFVRSWCLGCLAVCLWYEDVRHVHTVAI